jgi:maltose O-acetyltransferase
MMSDIFRGLLDRLLRREWSYRLLIVVPILPGEALVFRLRERCHRLRLKRRGIGGYLQDTLITFPENVSIGDRVTCGGRILIDGSGGVTIGSDTMIAHGAIITSASHDPSAEVMNRSNLYSPVVIGNNCWVGAGAKILPGVELADGVIVAAGAVVRGSFLDPDVIVGGVPARVLRARKPCQPLGEGGMEVAKAGGTV